ncbi:pyridoxal phosphate-dependent aminotransferase [Irregularibacter muris]
MKKMLSDYIKNITPSATLSVTATANQLKAEGLDVITFGVGEPDFDTPEYIREAGIRAIQKGLTKYTPVNGILSLREAISEKLRRDNNIDYSPEEIIINSGAKHSISTALQAICNPGDEIIIPIPYWVSYPEMVKLVGAVPIFVQTQKENNFKITGEELLSAITPKTKAIFLNTPNNPLGTIYSKNELETIANIAIEKQIYVISDEIYEKMVYDGKKHTSIASLNSEIRELTILINGMSKSYAMTGWRLGYTASNRTVIKTMGTIQSHATSHPSSITQYAGLAALQEHSPVLYEMTEEFNKRRLYMVERLKNMANIDYIYPEGAFYVFVDISKAFGAKVNERLIDSSVSFAELLLEKAHVAVIPGTAFGMDNFIRLSYATSMENIKEGLDRLEAFIKS